MNNRQWFNVIWFLLLIVFMSCLQNTFYEKSFIVNVSNFVMFFITPALFVSIVRTISNNTIMGMNESTN
jgi:hypothetical protein